MVGIKAKVVASDIDCIVTNYTRKYKWMVGKDTKEGGHKAIRSSQRHVQRIEGL